jgi:hypothetical protein
MLNQKPLPKSVYVCYNSHDTQMWVVSIGRHASSM